MYSIGDIANTIICGHSLEVLKQIPAESVHMCMTSPPYQGKRSYKTSPLTWDGDAACEHEFSIETEAGDIRYRAADSSSVTFHKDPSAVEGNGKGHICSICGAWRGELGHEPTPELYIKHLCDIFDEVKRVLRKDGTCFVNIGDSYWGSGGSIGHTPETRNFGRKTFDYGAFPAGTISRQKHQFLQPKSQCCVPEMFVMEMVKRGWIKRNTLIWHKPNCTPESADDRFTNDFEPVFFFTKNNDNLYWTNEKSLKLVARQPRTDIEGIDWEWQPCRKCSGTGYRMDAEDVDTSQRSLDAFLGDTQINGNHERTICKKCSGQGRIKFNLWTGHDYYFEQQFEPYHINRWGGRFKKNDKVKTEGVPVAECGSQSSLNRIGYDCYPNPFGRNMRCVWKIKVAQFKGAHFAVYPEELCERPVRAGSPEFVCKSCGMPRVKILKPTGNYIVYGGYGSKTAEHIGVSPTSSILTKSVQEKAIVGYSDCECSAAGYEPGIVLDPFMGSGTTAVVALKLNRKFIGIDSNPEYVEMATGRIKPFIEQKKLVEVFS